MRCHTWRSVQSLALNRSALAKACPKSLTKASIITSTKPIVVIAMCLNLSTTQQHRSGQDEVYVYEVVNVKRGVKYDGAIVVESEVV